jgi:membrane fusion protein, multidrug efflux system
VSQEELEKAARSRDSAQGELEAAAADLKQQQLNLVYAKVVAPISGRADKANVTVGNLVTANASTATLLTTIVTLQPMYVEFSVDEPTLLRLRQLVGEGKVKPPAEKAPEVFFGVGRGDDYPYRATVDYISNRVEGSTGTLQVRAVFLDKDQFQWATHLILQSFGAQGLAPAGAPAGPLAQDIAALRAMAFAFNLDILRPGLFARIRVPVGDPHPALLVTEQALMTNQGQQYVYVVNDQNEVVYRPVTGGAVDGGLRIITDGLKPGERVIIDGATRVRPGTAVDPKPGQMDAAPGKAPDRAGGKPAPGAGATK